MNLSLHWRSNGESAIHTDFAGHSEVNQRRRIFGCIIDCKQNCSHKCRFRLPENCLAPTAQFGWAGRAGYHGNQYASAIAQTIDSLARQNLNAIQASGRALPVIRRACLPSGGACSISAPSLPQPPVIRAQTTLVVVPALVATTSGEPVFTLSAAGFHPHRRRQRAEDLDRRRGRQRAAGSRRFGGGRRRGRTPARQLSPSGPID